MSKLTLGIFVGLFVSSMLWSIIKLTIYQVSLENPTVNNTIRYVILYGIFNLTLTFAGILAIYFKVK